MISRRVSMSTVLQQGKCRFMVIARHRHTGRCTNNACEVLPCKLEPELQEIAASVGRRDAETPSDCAVRISRDSWRQPNQTYLHHQPDNHSRPLMPTLLLPSRDSPHLVQHQHCFPC